MMGASHIVPHPPKSIAVRMWVYGIIGSVFRKQREKKVHQCFHTSSDIILIGWDGWNCQNWSPSATHFSTLKFVPSCFNISLHIFLKRKHIHPHMCFCIHFLHFFYTSISYKKSIFVHCFELQNETQNFKKHKYRHITMFWFTHGYEKYKLRKVRI